MIALPGAMDAAIAELQGALESLQYVNWSGFTVHPGLLANREVIVAKSGVGKTMSALLAQRIIDTYAPSAIVFIDMADGKAVPDFKAFLPQASRNSLNFVRAVLKA